MQKMREIQGGHQYLIPYDFYSGFTLDQIRICVIYLSFSKCFIGFFKMCSIFALGLQVSRSHSHAAPHALHECSQEAHAIHHHADHSSGPELHLACATHLGEAQVVAELAHAQHPHRGAHADGVTPGGLV